MKRLIPCLLILSLLLTGCGLGGLDAALQPGRTAEEARQAMAPWLEQPCSFTFTARFQGPDPMGLEETIEQRYAADGSFSFFLRFQGWGADLDWEDAWYHYAPENGRTVCTMRHGDEAVTQLTLSEDQMAEIEQSRRQMLGVDTLLPSWAEDFRQEEAEGEPELLCFRYALPLARIMEGDGNLLLQVLNNVLRLWELDAFPDGGQRIYAALYADRETLRPVRLRYETAELAPTQSASATGAWRLEIEFVFDYDLADTVPLPPQLQQTETASAALDPELPVGELTERADAAYYVNQTLGFGCTLNHDWFMISRDDPQTGAAGRVSFIDLSAQRRDASAGLNILVEDASRPGREPESPEEYRDLSLPGVRQELEQYGCANIRVEANTFVFVGQEYPGIRFSCATPHQDWYCQQIIIGSGQYIVTVSLSTYDQDWLEELAALFYPLDGAAAAEASDLPQPGVIEAGVYRQPFFGLGLSLEGWEQADRNEMGLYAFGIPDYASYSLEELLRNHVPYVDVMLNRGGSTVYVMLELPPITSSDGSVSNTPAEYIDADARNIPADYEDIGVTIVSDERFQRELCGMTFEGYRLAGSRYGKTMYTAMLITEKNGVFFTIIVSSVGTDETDEILAGFFPLD